MRTSFRLPLLAAGLAALLLLASACQGPPGPPGPAGPAGPAGPVGPGGAKGLAAVADDATLIRGVNVESVEWQQPGRFQVTFSAEVDVANGYYLVTPGLVGTCATMISAEKAPGNAVWVIFTTEKPGPDFINCAFSLAVF